MIEIARELRSEPTESEALLWAELRDRKLGGCKFRRQQPIGTFVVDFYCDEAGLVVEVDGPIHRAQHKADKERQRLLEDLGLRVLRIAADEVERNIERTLVKIQRHCALTPGPLSLGERG